jgi:hypothetical protein
VHNWEYPCVQGCEKDVHGTEKYSKSVYMMLKSVSKVCNAYFAHTFNVLLNK